MPSGRVRRILEKLIAKKPSLATDMAVRAYSSKELLKVGDRSFRESLRDPFSRFDAEELSRRGVLKALLASVGVLTVGVPLARILGAGDQGRSYITRFTGVLPPSYIVFPHGGRAYAKCCLLEKTGLIEFQGDDHAEVLQSAIDGTPDYGSVVVKGDLVNANAQEVLVNKPITLRINGTITEPRLRITQTVHVKGYGALYPKDYPAITYGETAYAVRCVGKIEDIAFIFTAPNQKAIRLENGGSALVAERCYFGPKYWSLDVSGSVGVESDNSWNNIFRYCRFTFNGVAFRQLQPTYAYFERCYFSGCGAGHMSTIFDLVMGSVEVKRCVTEVGIDAIAKLGYGDIILEKFSAENLVGHIDMSEATGICTIVFKDMSWFPGIVRNGNTQSLNVYVDSIYQRFWQSIFNVDPTADPDITYERRGEHYVYAKNNSTTTWERLDFPIVNYYYSYIQPSFPAFMGFRSWSGEFRAGIDRMNGIGIIGGNLVAWRGDITAPSEEVVVYSGIPSGGFRVFYHNLNYYGGYVVLEKKPEGIGVKVNPFTTSQGNASVSRYTIYLAPGASVELGYPYMQYP